jgi:ABC-2 type transport system permease protein
MDNPVYGNYHTNQFLNTLRLAGKEFVSFFQSPLAYVFISVYLVVSGLLFFNRFFLHNELTMRVFFEQQPIILSILVPTITMAMFSEEKKSGSIELLFTLPISRTGIVLGKFIAAFLFLCVNLFLTTGYTSALFILGKPDLGMIFGGYFGLIFTGAAYISVGMIVSAITPNQIISLIVGLLSCSILYWIGVPDLFLDFMPPFFGTIISYLSISTHTHTLAKGVVNLRDIIYFLSVIVLALYLTKIIISERD